MEIGNKLAILALVSIITETTVLEASQYDRHKIKTINRIRRDSAKSLDGLKESGETVMVPVAEDFQKRLQRCGLGLPSIAELVGKLGVKGSRTPQEVKAYKFLIALEAALQEKGKIGNFQVELSRATSLVLEYEGDEYFSHNKAVMDELKEQKYLVATR